MYYDINDIQQSSSVRHVGGMRIYTNALLTESGEPYTVDRTWKERLFSLPWKPWKSTKVIIPTVPSTKVYALSDNILIMHPDMEHTIYNQLQALATQQGKSTLGAVDIDRPY
jgi:hypothetical protein